MDIQTRENEDVMAGNFTVAAMQRQVFSHSNITAFLVNKAVTNIKNDTTFTGNPYNTVAGLEYNLASANNKWTGKAFYHQSFYEGASGNAATAAVNITYSTQFLTASLNQSWVGADYIAEVGYIRRKGYYEINPMVQYKFFPSSSRIANHGPVFKLDLLFDPSLKLTDREVQLGYQAEWLNKSIVTADVKETYIMLQAPFDPTNTGGIPLPAGEDYDWKEVGASFASDIRKPFHLLISSRYGGYYDGTRWTIGGELNYRVQPFGSLALVTTYNDISMPSPYNSAKFFLVGPRLDITFTDKLFFTSFVQYNNQIDNINLNLRFQWRFAPVSDLFIVYTENSIPGDYTVKNRGLVVKLSYWFN